MDIGAWSAILHGVAELATTEVTEHRHTNFLKTKTPENLGNCAVYFLPGCLKHKAEEYWLRHKAAPHSFQDSQVFLF